MGFMENIRKRAKSATKIVAIPEANDHKMLLAAEHAAKEKYAKLVLVGDKESLLQSCISNDIDPQIFSFADTADDSLRSELAAEYAALPNAMIGEKSAFSLSRNPLHLALIMEAVGRVDCTVAGLSATTLDVVTASMMVIGLDPNVKTVSSCGFFEIEGLEGRPSKLFGYGDSAICLNPTAEELSGIAITCCETFRALAGDEPRCALLSYSTCGSGSGESVEKVREAVHIAQASRSDLKIDGEFQLDAAINSSIADKKVKRESDVAGKANLIIWPNIDTGNVGIKLIQQFSQPKCYGPFLQGFKKPLIDVSRGESMESLANTIAAASVLAAVAESR